MQAKTQRYAVYVVGLAAWILLLGAVWSQAVAASLPAEYADGLAVRNSLLASQIRDVAGEWYANGEWGRFPLFPGLVRLLYLGGLDLNLAMWIVHSAGVALGLLALYAYWADQAGPEFGWRAAAWMTAPTPLGAGVVWLMFFEEPLHIAALCGSLLLYNRRRFGLAALALAAAVASKPFGVLMLALLVIDMALKRARWRDVVALALLPAAVWLGWQLWVYAQTRAFLLPYTIQSATWARYAGFQILLENLGKGLRLEPFILVYSNVVFTQTIPFATVGLAYLFALARRRVVAWYWWPFTAVSVWLTLYYTPREAARIVIPTLFPLIPLFLLGRNPAGRVKRLERAVWLAMWAGQLALASAGVNYQLNGTRVGFWP